MPDTLYLLPVKKRKSPYRFSQLLSASLLVVSLLWLTVSTPFVFNAQQQCHAWSEKDALPEDDLPLAGSTEEKSPTSQTVQEEYLHDEDDSFLLSSLYLQHASMHPPQVYVAFHGELLSPPPESRF
jgi:hypothetical protein